MPYIEPEALQEARRMDLLTWLRFNDPGNLVHVSGNTFCTADHDSLKISNGKWYWFSRGMGGVSALDYLIKVKYHMGSPQGRKRDCILPYREADEP